MYCAKQLGGAQIVLFDPEMYTQVLARMELETDLRKACTGDQPTQGQIGED